MAGDMNKKKQQPSDLLGSFIPYRKHLLQFFIFKEGSKQGVRLYNAFMQRRAQLLANGKIKKESERKALALWLEHTSLVCRYGLNIYAIMQDEKGYDKRLSLSVSDFYELHNEIAKEKGSFYTQEDYGTIENEAFLEHIDFSHLFQSFRPSTEVQRKVIKAKNFIEAESLKITTKKAFFSEVILPLFPTMFSEHEPQEKILKSQEFTLYWLIFRPDDSLED